MSQGIDIPITRPFFDEREAEAAAESVRSGWVTQGPRVKQFEDAFAAYVGSGYACAVSSCTAALHLSLLTVGVQPGDVVITVSHSFVASANAVRYCGAEPLFIDIDPDTYNMSARHLERCLSEDCHVRNGQLFFSDVQRLAIGESPLRYFLNQGRRGTKQFIGRVAAIMPVHQMGMPCDLKSIMAIADKFDLPVIEDAACAAGSEININGIWERIGRPYGDIACFSFHPRKLITTGDGGMITTDNADYDRRFRLLRQHGMDVSDLIRHSSNRIIFEKYVTTGYNYRMTDIQAAVGIEQLNKLNKILSERRRIAGIYKESLGTVPWLKMPSEPDYCRTNWQSYPVRLLSISPLSRNDLMQHMLNDGIATRPGIMNAHQEQAYNLKLDLKNSEAARDSVIILPLYYGMTEREIEKVVCRIRNV